MTSNVRGPTLSGAGNWESVEKVARFLATYQRGIGSLIKRLPDSMKRATVDAALWHLERTAYMRLRDSD